MEELDPIIELDDFQKALGKVGNILLDCRGSLTDSALGRLLYAEGHIPGAQHIDVNTEAAGPVTKTSGRKPLPNKEAIEETLQGLGISSESEVTLYDSGRMNLAPRVWFVLRWAGLKRVRVLNGGFNAWCKAQLPLETKPVRRPRGHFTFAGPAERVWTTPEIETILGKGKILLLDARNEVAYLGLQNGLDTKAGHIPGSESLPSTENIGPDGRLRDKASLRARFLRLGPPERIVHTCGAGIAACGNLLAMRHAGLASAGIYIGSFSEWIRDPRHPIATGEEDSS